jgi:hypothetical protein
VRVTVIIEVEPGQFIATVVGGIGISAGIDALHCDLIVRGVEVSQPRSPD